MFARFIKDTCGATAAEYALTFGVLGFGVVLGNVAVQNGVANEMNGQAAAMSAPVNINDGGDGSSGGNGSGNGGGGSGDSGSGGDGSGGSGGNCKPKKNC